MIKINPIAVLMTHSKWKKRTPRTSDLDLSCRVYWRVNGSVVLIKITSRSAGASGGIHCVASPGLRTASGASWLVLYSALYLQHREWGNPESTEIVTGNLPNPHFLFTAGSPKSLPSRRTWNICLFLWGTFHTQGSSSWPVLPSERRKRKWWREQGKVKEGNGRRGKPLVLVSFWQLLLFSVSSLLPSEEKKTSDHYIYITVIYI